MSRNTYFVWLLIAALSVGGGAWLWASGLSVAGDMFLPTLVPVLATGFLSWIYTYKRPDPRIAAFTHMIAEFLAFTFVTVVLSYLTATLRRPLMDAYLVALDRRLGFDWPSLYDWVSLHPRLHTSMLLIYLSLVPQMIFLILFLNYLGRIRRAWELQWLFFVICLGCLFVSALWPAEGAFGYFHIQSSEPYVHEFMALRDGTLKIIGNGKEGVQGIIQFPSLHTALAILYVYAARGIPILFPVLATLNILVVIVTPTIGGHHFSDVLGGALLAFTAILLSRKILDQTSREKNLP